MKSVNRVLISAGLYSVLMCAALPAHAYVMGQISVKATQLRFSSQVPGVTFGWTNDWHGSVAAESVHSQAGGASNSDESFANDADLAVTSLAGPVTASAEYTLVDGLDVIVGAGSVSGGVSTGLELLGAAEMGSSEATTQFSNHFRLTGAVGTTVAPVTLLLDYTYDIDAQADAVGEWDLITEVLLGLFDADDFANDPDNVDPFADTAFTVLEQGRDASYFHSGNGTLALTVNLEMEKNYLLQGQLFSSLRGANDEPVVDVSEPGSFSLLALSMLGLMVRRGRRL
jgi:hypothetical protein